MTVTQRGPSSWQASICIQRKRYRRSFRTREEAVMWEAETRVNLLKGAKPEQLLRERVLIPTMGRMFEILRSSHWDGTPSEKDIVSRGKYVLETFGAETPIDEVSKGRIETAVKKWREYGLSGSTINGRLAVVSKMLQEAEERGAISSAPRIKREQQAEARLRWLTHTEEERIIAWFEDQNLLLLSDLFQIAVDTGMRRGELLSLCPRDIDFSGDGWVYLDGRKTKRKRSRSIPLTRRARVILERLAEGRARDAVLFPLKEGYVFSHWDRMRRSLRLGRDVVFHTCRHTFASRLAQAGADLVQIRDLVGHTTLAMSLRYAKIGASSLRRAVSLIERPDEVP